MFGTAAVHEMMIDYHMLVHIISTDVQVNQPFERSLEKVLIYVGNKLLFFIGAPYYIIRIYKFDGRHTKVVC